MIQRLDINSKPETTYCVSLFVRDANIRHSMGRVKARICGPVDPSTRGDEPIAIACFGPSLNDTWEKLRDFKTIISCSGAHKFLLERGIVPTYHTEVDPRPHKATLIGTPHKEVQYLIASTCHRAVFDLLEGYDVRLWHVFDNQEEALRTLPPGEWALTGGSSVGLRAMTLARHLGYTNLHVFGMDGNESDAYGKHAAEHPSQPKGYCITEYKGVEYKTTPSLLACTKQTFHELNQMYDVRATFYGDGLVQALAKDYVREPARKDQAIIGFAKPELISAEYRELNARLHLDNAAYGAGGGKYAPIVLDLAKSIEAHSICDYGCGKSSLRKALAETWGPIWEYDPAVPGKDESPPPCDLVCCFDVLEHVESDRILPVLADLRRCVRKLGYFIVHTGPSSKKLADGRNAHVLQRDAKWWTKMLGKFFRVAPPLKAGPLLHFVVEPLIQQASKTA